MEPREAIDVRDPRRYARVTGDPLDTDSLPPWCYTSDAFHAAERERVLARSWLCVGRVDMLAGAGAYRALDVAGHRVLLVRSEDGTIRALANVCRHRGTKLLEGAGTTRWIRCLFHNWTYGLDGALRGAPDMDATRGFDPTASGLLPYDTGVWNGFLFVRLTPGGPSLEASFGAMTDLFAPFRLADMVTTRTRTYDVQCNWKLFLDVFMEDYHLKAVHGASIAATYIKPAPPETGPGYASIWNPHEGTSGLTSEDRDHAFPPMTGLPASGTRYGWLYPSFAFAVTVDSVWFFEVEPDGPGRSRVAMHMGFPRAIAERNDFAKKAERYYARWHCVLDEDNRVLALQQQGLESPAARAGRYSFLEPVPSRFAQWLVAGVTA